MRFNKWGREIKINISTPFYQGWKIRLSPKYTYVRSYERSIPGERNEPPSCYFGVDIYAANDNSGLLLVIDDAQDPLSTIEMQPVVAPYKDRVEEHTGYDLNRMPAVKTRGIGAFSQEVMFAGYKKIIEQKKILDELKKRLTVYERVSDEAFTVVHDLLQETPVRAAHVGYVNEVCDLLQLVAKQRGNR